MAFEISVASAMRASDRILDIRTGFGVVRLYHFAGVGADGAKNADAVPLLLLPGTMSATPVWADNLPSLLRLRSVYTVDLLGEPGLSVQQRPISDPGDHAEWLHQMLLALPEPQVHLVPAGATVKVYPGASHAINGEHPDRIAADLSAFLEGKA